MAKKYTDKSIESISARDFTRLRPGVYAGSTEYSTQLLKEIFSNSLDEHIAGRCSIIEVQIDTKNNIYVVKDNGQGFPINSVREDGETVLQAAFDVMNTSGKYRNGTEESCYYGSVGTNGCGCKVANFLSNFLVAYSSNGSMYEEVSFTDGLFVNRKIAQDPYNRSGTCVTWQPDPQFFQNKEVNIQELKKLFGDLAALCPQLIIKLAVDDEFIEYKSENGLQDLVNQKIKKELISNRFTARKVDEQALFDICMTYDTGYHSSITAYANYGLTERGVHISAVRAGVTRQINRYAVDNSLLKKSDNPLTQSELDEGLVLVFNIKTTEIKYDSQVKTNVVDLNKTLINSVINNDFYDWLNNNPKDAKIIIEKALLARKAKLAAQKAKDVARGLKQKKSDKFLNLPTKLVDANPRDKDRSKCILYLVEGDSAANGLISKRNGEIHGIMPLRGKILSVRKASVADMYKNQEISNIVAALGLDANPSDYTLKYDIKKLRYHKIVLLEDGDPDGGHIRLLLITLLWRLCPELLQNGHVYTSRPPLYKITNSKNQYCYLATESDLEVYKKKHVKEKFIVNRIKGLGELSPSELYECMIKDDTENIMQLDVQNFTDTDNELEKFMGTEVAPRREYYNLHFNDIKIDIE